MASTSPWWSSEITSWVPERPLATRGAEEGEPPGPVFCRSDVDTEDLSVSLTVHPRPPRGRRC